MESLITKRVQEIKRSFRQMMDGATSASMREKGLCYKLNWGASLPMLRQQAEEIGKDYDLAIALWKENIRECKLLATMIMPPETILPEVVDIWMEQSQTVEVAEQAAYNLYQHLPYAAEKAYQWIASPLELYQLCGFHVLSRLFMKGLEPNERGINEYIDQAIICMQDGSLSVRKAARQSLIRFSELGLVYERLVNSALRQTGLEL